MNKFNYLTNTLKLQVAILFSQMPPDLVGEKIEKERLYDAVNVILSLQVIIQPYKFYF